MTATIVPPAIQRFGGHRHQRLLLMRHACSRARRSRRRALPAVGDLGHLLHDPARAAPAERTRVGYWLFVVHVAVALELVLLAPFMKLAHAVY